MAAAFEIIAEPSFGPVGTFAPQADQAKFRSCFAIVDGPSQPGWETKNSMQQGIPTQDGRRKLTFDEFKRDGKVNDIMHKGMRLREFVTPVEQARAKEQYDAGISNEVVANYMKPSEKPASDQAIGRSSSGSAQNIEVTIPAAVS